MQARKFFIKALIFILINTGIACLSIQILHYIENRHQYKNFRSDLDLLVIPKNKQFDLLFLGSSHARIFTRDKNHLRAENILHKSMIDLGKGGGEGGIITNLVMAKYFFEQGNSANHIIYFIDAWPFFTSKWNEKSYFLTTEPLSWKLLVLALKYHVDKDVLLNYFKSKYDIAWWQRKPSYREINNDELKYENPEAIKKRIASLYIEPFDEQVFAHYAERLEEVVKLAKTNHAQLTFVFPSTLLDDNRGKEKVIALLQRFKDEYGTDYYDYSNVITDYHYYY